MTRLRPALATLATGCLLALGCSHADPFEPDTPGLDQPLQPGALALLTFNTLGDHTPSFLPDGSAFYYSYDRAGPGATDRCLGLLPATGGSRIQETCEPRPTAVDSVDAFESAAASALGVLLYQRSSSSRSAVASTSSALVMAPASDPYDAEVITTVPYVLPGATRHDRIGPVSWLDDRHAVYLGSAFFPRRLCSSCVPDTTGVAGQAVMVDLSGPAPVLSVIPGTDGASAVTADPERGLLWLTFLHDTRLYSLPPGGGTPTARHNFDSLGVARDPAPGAGRIWVVVGGVIEVGIDENVGAFQVDDGGLLYGFDPVTETAVLHPLGMPLLVRRPAERPGVANRLVFEGINFRVDTTYNQVTGQIQSVDTTLTPRAANLWLLEAQ